MDRNNAVEFAKNHINLKNKVNVIPNLIWIESKPIDLGRFWFFNYEYKLLNEDMNLAIGGAPGFTICKNSEAINDISWQEYHELSMNN
ncbi:hypothetical protein FNJ87_17310 [Nonlabens mediterrranea]|uniref:Immunity protein 35 domain-containing protein n=1 Tax=Nonlabens mediterrranea TaxID=1419947 RepID=A0ABS0A9D4_9FLAO|nr:hypothetical protein [Nonlabens mediterrranea]